MFVSGFQFAHQVELARHEADYEQRELDELLRWLDHAEDVLQIVDRPVHDRQKEYQVNSFCNILFFSVFTLSSLVAKGYCCGQWHRPVCPYVSFNLLGIWWLGQTFCKSIIQIVFWKKMFEFLLKLIW